jgi:AraC family transcriptional regulator
MTEIVNEASARTSQLPMHSSISSGPEFSSKALDARIEVHPSDAATRREAKWRGLTAETFQFTAANPFKCDSTAPCHILIATERGAMVRGESSVEGIVTSTRRELGRTLSLVPKDHVFHGWFHPRVPPRGGSIYIDPVTPLADPELRFADVDFEPRLYFNDRDLWATAGKILRLVEDPASTRLYAETLGAALVIELVRSREGGGLRPQMAQGGLAAWQQRLAIDFMNDNLARDISLQELAGLVRLSPTHFCRAFAHSVGMPPHQYQLQNRIERAKLLLADVGRTITEVALATGYSAPSNFATAFRRVTGLTPREFRRMRI